MKSKKALVVVSIILIFSVLIVTAAVGKNKAKVETVKTTTVSKGDIASYLSTNAVIQSKNSKAYMGAAQLTVKGVKVKVGDPVKQGQVMIEYNLADLNTSVQQAKIQYNNAILQKNDMVNQKKQIDDTINKLDAQIRQLEQSKNPSDTVTLQTLKQKRESIQPISNDKIQLMSNSVSLAKLSLDSANARYESYKNGIVADFGGVVTELNAVEGAALNPAQAAIVIQQLDNLKAVISLGKYDALKVKEGQEAILKNGSNNYKGTVAFIDPAASRTVSAAGQATSLEVQIDIKDAAPDLKIDFDVTVDILLGSAKDVLKIPVEAIKYDKGGKTYVFKIVDGIARQIAVKLWIQSDTEAEVIEGLELNDTVILNPGIAIKDGTSVKTSEVGRR